MVIVIVHWKIHKGRKARNDFFDYWSKLNINNRNHFVGEFLSKPMTKKQAGFECIEMNIPNSPKYVSYFNVGIWNTIGAFKKEVISKYVGATPITQPFEYEYRERMVLSPNLWRVGSGVLPKKDKTRKDITKVPSRS